MTDIIFSKDRLSNCCGAPVSYDSDICSDCKEHCAIEKTCNTCDGTGVVDIVDEDRITSKTIDVPYKKITCPDCDGEGLVEIDPYE